MTLPNLDEGGVMIRAAAVVGKHHAKLGLKPYLAWQWNTLARNKAYREAYDAALNPKPASDGDGLAHSA